MPANEVDRMPDIERDDPRQDDGWRLYLLLALCDRRDGSWIAELVQAAREGYERCGTEEEAWAEFDRLWNQYTARERIREACRLSPNAPVM